MSEKKKLMIASDIHGSAFWCAKMLEAWQAERPEKLLLLGDLLYHGPRNDLPDGYSPKDVAAMLNPLRDNIVCVRGNCDSEVDQMVLEFPISADYAMLFFAGKTLCATHGHLYGEHNPPPLSRGEILLNGHTHLPCHKELPGGILYVNCGSTALPKENSPHSYLLLTDEGLEWKDLGSKQVFDRLPATGEK